MFDHYFMSNFIHHPVIEKEEKQQN